MKKSISISCLIVASALGLAACSGSNHSRVHEKQRAPSDIKIRKLNIANKTIDLRFEYRTHVKKTLEQVKCYIELNSGSSSLSLEQYPHIQLDVFSTEVLSFKNISITNSEPLNSLVSINYSLSCYLKYDKGTEDVYENSVLHLVPGSKSSYR